MNPKRPPYKNSEFIKDLWHFLKIHKGELIFLTILLAISVTTGLISTVILAKIIDFFISGDNNVNTFYFYLGTIIGLGVFGTLLRHFAKYFLGAYTAKIQRYAKIESFQKVLQGDLIWQDTESTGAKMQKVMGGEKAIGGFMDFYINKGIGLIIITLGVIGVFAYFNIKYALIAILFTIIYLYADIKLNKKLAQKTLERKIAGELVAGKAYEFSSNISTIKSLGIEKASGKQIIDKEELVFQAKMARRKASTKKWIIVNLISIFFFSLFVYLVGMDILAGVLTIGSIVIYTGYIGKLRDVLAKFSVESTNLIDIKYSLYRMMEIYKTIPEINEEDAKPLKEWDKIQIKDLSFKYKNQNILENLNLEIKKGEKIGIVGMSGSGKSTLFKLLLKLHLPQKGSIYFNDKQIQEITRESILDKISVVPQETELFNLRLKDNITLSGKGKFDPIQYKKALIVSQTDKFITKLEEKDQSLIGEKGVRLSGGERQRLGIARAIYKDSDIIIFDEATSNLDYSTEKRIQENLDKLKDKTLIMSAHRLSTLQHMDKIYFIKQGKVIEQGTYDELLRKKGKFYKLWKEQKAWKNA